VRQEVATRLEAKPTSSNTGSSNTSSASDPNASTGPAGLPIQDIKATLGGIGAGIGGFFGSRVAGLRGGSKAEGGKGLRPISLIGSASSGNIKGKGA
jgi:hypothetical protein